MNHIDALAPHLLGVRQHMQDLRESGRERSSAVRGTTPLRARTRRNRAA